MGDVLSWIFEYIVPFLKNAEIDSKSSILSQHENYNFKKS